MIEIVVHIPKELELGQAWEPELALGLGMAARKRKEMCDTVRFAHCRRIQTSMENNRISQHTVGAGVGSGVGILVGGIVGKGYKEKNKMSEKRA